MNVSLGFRKNGFDAYGGKVPRKKDMAYWMNDPLRTDPDGVALGLSEEVEAVAELCWGRCRQAILDNGHLAEVMRKAADKGGFLLDFSEE